MSIQIKTAAVTGPKTCEILELTTPDLGRGEVLVKVHAVALCTLEQRIFRGEVKMPLPCTGGHEVAGEIAALGPGVNTKLWAEGQRVAVRLLYNCGECYYCRTGRTNMCERAQKKPVREGLLPGPRGAMRLHRGGCRVPVQDPGYPHLRGSLPDGAPGLLRTQREPGQHPAGRGRGHHRRRHHGPIPCNAGQAQGRPGDPERSRPHAPGPC